MVTLVLGSGTQTTATVAVALSSVCSDGSYYVVIGDDSGTYASDLTDSYGTYHQNLMPEIKDYNEDEDKELRLAHNKMVRDGWRQDQIYIPQRPLVVYRPILHRRMMFSMSGWVARKGNKKRRGH